MQRFLRAYRVALLGSALAWRTIFLVALELPERPHIAGLIVLYPWGLAPYLALAGLAGRIRRRRLLIASGLVLLAGDVMVGRSVLHPSSSTAVVALLTYPLLATFGLVPITWFVGWLRNR